MILSVTSCFVSIPFMFIALELESQRTIENLNPDAHFQSLSYSEDQKMNQFVIRLKIIIPTGKVLRRLMLQTYLGEMKAGGCSWPGRKCLQLTYTGHFTHILHRPSLVILMILQDFPKGRQNLINSQATSSLGCHGQRRNVI